MSAARFRIAGLAALALACSAAAAMAKSQCVSCHAALDEKQREIVSRFRNDIHRERGVSCHGCHGGDSSAEEAWKGMDPGAGFVGAPSKAETPAFCGKCHSRAEYIKRFNPALPVDQEKKYFTSGHGRRLKKGDSKVAACSSCHTAHSILPSKDPRSTVYAKNIPATCGKCHSDAGLMKSYGLPADQAAKYAGSVHGKALLERGDIAAPVCNDCHGNHGAGPPGVRDIAMVCGLCHPHNMELFNGSPMASQWKKKKFHACATCHGSHDVGHPTAAMLGAENGLCRRCHRAGDKGLAAGAAIKGLMERMEAGYRETEETVRIAEEKGMDVPTRRTCFRKRGRPSFWPRPPSTGSGWPQSRRRRARASPLWRRPRRWRKGR
ncbi:MAG: cytochrome c3 family protein [Elusimicrobiota bacterium]